VGYAHLGKELIFLIFPLIPSFYTPRFDLPGANKHHVRSAAQSSIDSRSPLA
jgi:hypothetical protein